MNFNCLTPDLLSKSPWLPTLHQALDFCFPVCKLYKCPGFCTPDCTQNLFLSIYNLNEILKTMWTNTCHRVHLAHKDRIRHHTKPTSTCISYETLLVRKGHAQGLCPWHPARVQAHNSVQGALTLARQASLSTRSLPWAYLSAQKNAVWETNKIRRGLKQ